MTIEIKQLVIRAAVRPAPDRPGAPAAALPAPPPPARAEIAPRVDVEAVVAECTRRVLRQLRKRQDR